MLSLLLFTDGLTLRGSPPALGGAPREGARGHGVSRPSPQAVGFPRSAIAGLWARPWPVIVPLS